MTAFSKKTIRICEIIERQGVASQEMVRIDMPPEEQKNINSAFRSARRRGLLILACGQFGYQYRVAPDWRQKVKEAATPKFKRINPLRCPANSIFQVGMFVAANDQKRRAA
jgi:hypothetical protein